MSIFDDSSTDGKLRVRAFHRFKRELLRTSQSKVMTILSLGLILKISWKSAKFKKLCKIHENPCRFLGFCWFSWKCQNQAQTPNRNNFWWWCPQEFSFEPMESPDSQLSIGWRIVENWHNHQKLWWIPNFYENLIFYKILKS